MIEFISAALPFVIIGICIAIIAVKCAKAKNKEEKESLAVRMALGMVIGMCAGVAVSSVFYFNLALCISLGMLVGETAGMFVKNMEEK